MGSKKIFQFKISLNDSSPRIWRRIQVPSTYSFFDLHVAIRDVMGWADSHLHAFYVRPPNGKQLTTIQINYPDMFDWDDYDSLDEFTEPIDKYFGERIKQCQYSYDFGDSWDHTVLFERSLPAAGGVDYPHCVTGAGACPPEDCGGVWGYERLQGILRDPRHQEHEDMLEWLGLDSADDFDSNHFDPDEISFDNPSAERQRIEEGIAAVEQDCTCGQCHKEMTLDERIESFNGVPLKRVGVWEIGRTHAPFSDAKMKKLFKMFIVVHQESQYVYAMKVSYADEARSATDALIEALEQSGQAPETVLVRNKVAFEELLPVGELLGFQVQLVTKLKTVPTVLRLMSQTLSKIRA